MKTKFPLQQIPGIGPSITQDLNNIGIHTIADLKGKNPYTLYELSNHFTSKTQDRCLLYVFRLAVYYAENNIHEPEKLKWWFWQDEQ